MNCLIVQSQAAPCFSVIISQNYFLPGCLKSCQKIYKHLYRRRRNLSSQSSWTWHHCSILPSVHNTDTPNKYVRDKHLRYALRILQTRNEGTCLRGVDHWYVYDILYMLSCSMALKIFPFWTHQLFVIRWHLINLAVDSFFTSSYLHEIGGSGHNLERES